MSFTVTERPDGSTNRSIEDSGKSGQRTLQRVFDVIGPATADEIEYELAFGVPRVGDPYGAYLSLWCRSVNTQRVSPILCRVTASYKGNSGTEEQEDNPLLQPADISFSTLTSEEAIDEDINGNPIATVNGEPLSGLTMPISDLACTITRNLAAFNPSSIYLYTNKTNSSSFLGFPSGTLRIADIQARSVFSDSFAYWVVSVTIHARKPLRTTDDRAWWKRLRHEGFYIDDGSGNIIRAVDADGQPVTSPVPIILDGVNDGEEETDKSVAYWAEFQVFDEIDFNSLGIL